MYNVHVFSCAKYSVQCTAHIFPPEGTTNVIYCKIYVVLCATCCLLLQYVSSCDCELAEAQDADFILAR